MIAGICRQAVCAVLVLAVTAACVRDDVDRADEPDVADAVDSATTAVDAVGIQAADPVLPDISEDPPVLTAAPDSSVVGSAEELATLSAALVVPVVGVERAQLVDSFTDGRGERVHEAIDILAPRGTPVVSATEGTLLRMFDSRPGGLMVYATDASRRFILLYGHLDGYAPGLQDGMRLERGQVIGYVGSTGNASPETPHLHFGILRGEPAVSWSEGVAVNPFPLLQGRPDRN